MFDCKRNLLIFTLITSFLVNAPSWGEETESVRGPSVQIELGGGEVRVAAEGVDLPEAALERLRTNLLVDDRIADLVTSQEITRMSIQGEEVSVVISELQRATNRLADQLQDRAVAELTGQSRPSNSGSGEMDGEQPGEIFIGEDLHILPQEQRDDLLVIMGDVRVEGRVHGLVVVNGDVELASGAEIKEDVVVIGGNVHLAPGARISDELVMIGGRLLAEPGSYVGAKRNITPRWKGTPYFSGHHMWMNWWSSLVSGVVGFLIAFGVLSLLRSSAQEFLTLARALWSQHPVLSAFSGLGVIISFLPGLVFLVVTLVGILLVPIYLLVVAILMLVAYAVIIGRLGELLLPSRPLEFWQRVLLGQALWTALSFVPILGPVVLFVLWMLGLGVSAQAAVRRYLAPA